MLNPHAFCTQDGGICQITLGEGEINSAATLMALVLSPGFDLSRTYFLIAGLAGVNPKRATLGSVSLARYAVQVALQYEIDPRSLPEDWTTGYIAYGRERPHEYPCITYGTEVFELSTRLRDRAYDLAENATLADQDAARQYRALYGPMGGDFEKAIGLPSIVKCDTATSDVYYSGRRLSEAFENTTNLWTNGTGDYCMSAQEDAATLEVLVRGAIERRVDFNRVILMRTGSNFDRPPKGRTDWEHLFTAQQNGFQIAVQNIYNVGVEVVKGILENWDCEFRDGLPADNYVGDIFGSLGGEPDFGFGSLTGGQRLLPGGKTRNLGAVEMNRRRQFLKKAVWEA